MSDAANDLPPLGVMELLPVFGMLMGEQIQKHQHQRVLTHRLAPLASSLRRVGGKSAQRCTELFAKRDVSVANQVAIERAT